MFVSDSASLTSGISGRYATALFELAKDAKQLDGLDSDVATLSEALTSSADLTSMINSPVYTRAEQGAAIAGVAKAMELSDLTANTLKLMATKRRLFVLPEMLNSIRALIAEEKGEVTADVTVAKPMSKKQSDDLATALKKAVGKDVNIETTVDESLIGGLVVKVGSRMIDSSIRAKLNKLQNVMKEVG